MSNPSRATCYADQAVQQQVVIQHNEIIGPDIWRLRFAASTIAQRAVPGQFVMLRVSGLQDPLIGRPLAIYEIGGPPAGPPQDIELLYHVRGPGTRRLAQMMPGQMLDVWGPLGNGFPPADAATLIMVAGGIGQTPFLTLAKEALRLATFGDPPRMPGRAERVVLCFGARTAPALVGVEDFQQLGIAVRLATDDGSRGHCGPVSELLLQELDQTTGPVQIVCCGPQLMMQRVAEIAAARRLPCLVSLETPMACGIGICFSCVAKVRQPDRAWDYRRTCVDGPVFPAEQIVWD